MALMMIFPSEAIMILAGYLASQGSFSLWLIILAGATGSTLGSAAIYVLARSAKQQYVYRLLDKYGRWVGVSRKRAIRAGTWFNKHAKTAVFFGRFVPGVRTAVSVPAGFERMPVHTFFACTFIGSGISAAFLAFVGYFSANHYAEYSRLLGTVATIVTIAAVAAFIGYLIRGRNR